MYKLYDEVIIKKTEAVGTIVDIDVSDKSLPPVYVVVILKVGELL